MEWEREKGRRGFLKVVKEGKEKRISGFVRSGNWPPPASFFEGGAIGLAYFLPSWFRYNLQAWIHDRMHELESKEGVYSLEGWQQKHMERVALASYAPGVAFDLSMDVSRAPLHVSGSAVGVKELRPVWVVREGQGLVRYDDAVFISKALTFNEL